MHTSTNNQEFSEITMPGLTATAAFHAPVCEMPQLRLWQHASSLMPVNLPGADS